MTLRTADAVNTPRKNLQLDEGALLKYLIQQVPEFPKKPISFSVKQFAHGQSNPTYLIQAEFQHPGHPGSSGGSGGSGMFSCVLRKKPPGPLLASAHQVDREYKVMAALANAATTSGRRVAVPRVLCLCEDPGVLGTTFYVMQHLNGRIFQTFTMPELNPQERAAVFQQMSSMLATLHSVDPGACGLGAFGRPQNYTTRQVQRWKKQYDASAVGQAVTPAMSELAEWLLAHVPAEPAVYSIVHGDFRLDNLVFSLQGTEVLGVLDWELSTLGDPLTDLAYTCLMYHLPRVAGVMEALDPDNLPEGVPTEADFVLNYCKIRNIEYPANTWGFYIGLGMFRAASILAGVFKRSQQGNASHAQANQAGLAVDIFARKALSLVKGPPILPPLKPAPSIFAPGGGRAEQLRMEVMAFLHSRIIPLEPEFIKHAQSADRWTILPALESLKAEARGLGLWNLWISPGLREAVLSKQGRHSQDFPLSLLGAGLSNLEYAPICEVMGRSIFAPEVFNCSAPDTGNMEVLARYGSEAQQQRWLAPLLAGRIRSCFAMTEPAVASSDATNIQSSITRNDQGGFTLQGRKWWTSGAMDPRCVVAIFMGKTDPAAPPHTQQSMVLVSMDSPGVDVQRALTVFGYDDAPHGHAEVVFNNVQVPGDAILLGEGRGFEIAQGRLGPGRLHHCMRVVGMAERAIEMMVERGSQRKTFGKAILQHGALAQQLAECRITVQQARLMVLNAAHQLDMHGNKKARGAIAMAKVVAPRSALKVLDQAIQVHGGAGVSQDFLLASFYAGARTLRLADGPDEVHLRDIARLEMKQNSRL